MAVVIPNRAQRRAYNKKMKKKYTLQDFAIARAVEGMQNGETDFTWLKKYVPQDFITHKDNWDLFPNGTKVKLNSEAILSRPQEYLSADFKAWVEENKEEIFTVVRDPENKENKGLVSVHYLDDTKDTEQSKTWLFDMFNDLYVWNDYAMNYLDPNEVESFINAMDNTKESLTVFENIDNLSRELEDEDLKKIDEIRSQIEKYDKQKGVEKLEVSSTNWSNYDSTLQNLITKYTDFPEEGKEEENEVVEDENKNIQEGGEK